MEAKETMQKFGRFLSAMVMPNIGAFIAWGLLTALFIPTGWMPNEVLAQAGAPMAKWLIPLLIGFTGGEMIYGHRGGVLGTIATAGIIAGADIPMFLGAMIMGPLGGWLIKKFDGLIEDHIPSGFEMLVNNFSAGIIGALLALLAFTAVGPVVIAGNNVLRSGVEAVVAVGLLPLASVIIEPAKILFLNNALNHGVLTPLGIQQAEEMGKSIFFLLEANPGPGFGILLAYWLFGKGMSKSSAPGAAIIHVLGGIHEIYFPYVLMKPSLLLAVIAGGMSGVFTVSLLGGGLIAPSSPGSIIAVLAMTPKGAFFANIADFLVSTVVSCAVASIFVKASAKDEDSLEDAQAEMSAKKAASKGQPAVREEKQVAGADIRTIVYACDAGMGSSALGAAALRKKLRRDGYKNISVTNCAIGNIPSDAQIVVSHEKLQERAIEDSPQAEHFFVKDFVQNDVYAVIAARLSGVAATGEDVGGVQRVGDGVLRKENIRLGLASEDRFDAIRRAGRLLADGGYVSEAYIEGMIAREKDITTYIGRGIAIPHGENAVKAAVKKSGLVVLQYPEGISFGEDTAHLVVGIAGKDSDHLAILANIATALDEYDDEQLRELYTTKDAEVLYKLFTSVND